MAKVDGKFLQDDWVEETPSGTVNGSNTVFTLSSVPAGSSLAMFINGLMLRKITDYTVSGTTVTFTDAPATASQVRAEYFKKN
jgi:hypothetical protein